MFTIFQIKTPKRRFNSLKNTSKLIQIPRRSLRLLTSMGTPRFCPRIGSALFGTNTARFLWQILQAVIAQAKKLNKDVYVLSIDEESGKVAHVNFVSESSRKNGLDARTWAGSVADVLGGKVGERDQSTMNCLLNPALQAGGKPESAQGVGTNVGLVSEALEVARKQYSSTIKSN